ncbi:2-dehydro-3-deoxyphosphooctonate aldolase (KDO 8-P synthase) [Marinitoga hydrogenitolerans DSM 16785]|uniref:2-dehydro-3-deoxyphosphooctonate aldolase n=1 Tax=Marinitoga hydrogenitolerans (strain DSM 16785 / JCM 12826 / AT1271) TaxID=1122195 RepID=A0A1M4ZWY4_MARH1|nr:3-deoxy-8-phosphooctulonate synthase [Marinitoga hydrogenitolerans]SHF22505.1 2-dehydro-3-deoxyphosphooctonate aldolase (KDO 8-P synthase) [Marinitoga hydrogenitolerans DSM 16785]
MNKTIKIKGFEINNYKPFILIAGPCAMESEFLVMKTAEKIKEITYKLGIPYIFKSSFDKANRTSIDSFRGPGLDKGLKILEKVKRYFEIPVTTDIHLPEQAKPVAEIADLLQIPAFLCRQTDLIVAAAKTGKPVNIKKGQFLAPWDMKNVVDKLVKSGNTDVILTERGTFFGYNNLVVDMTSLVEMKKIGFPVIFDATHSVQKPGAKGKETGGNREYVEYLSKAAITIGISGIFLEVHPDPDNALSDGPNMIKLENLEKLLLQIKNIDMLIKNNDKNEM